MNNKDNELFNEIIDIPSTDTNNKDYSQSNYSQPSIQPNLQNSVNQIQLQSMNNNLETFDMPTVINQSQSEIIDVQPSFEVPMVDLSQDLQSNNNISNVNYAAGSISAEGPEIIDFVVDRQPEQVNEQGKTINHELLQTLNNDTKNLVNPDMIINPFGKQNEESSRVNVEEPKVDYDEIKTKKGYVFMAIIFLIILVFIIFLPQIMSFIGI